MPRHAREKKIISIELIFLSILRILRNITNSRVEESKNRAITDEHANVSNSGFQFHRYPHRVIIQRTSKIQCEIITMPRGLTRLNKTITLIQCNIRLMSYAPQPI